jgi:streptogramin lyase
VADCDNDRIKIYDSTHQFLNGWGSTSSDDGAFHTPHGIAADGSGNIYVVDMYNNRIQKFNADGAFQMKFGRAGYGDGDMYYPVAIAPDSSGNIYVTDGYTDRVQKYGPDGTFILNWGSEGTGDGQFDGLRGIAVDGNGNVYVSDLRNHRIQKFTSQGVFLRQWGSSGTGDGQFYYPRGLAADTAGNIYVADTSNDRIQKFTSEGVFLAKWGSYGTGDGQLKNPEGVSVDAQGYVYVTDTDNHRIQKFTSSGQFVARIGAYGSDAGSLNEPTYSCIGPNGKIYVSDTNNHRVQVFRKANLIERKTKAIIVAGGGPFPQNTLWNATQLCASFAYRALTYQGYDSESIYYLSADTRLDIDGNGTPDVDANATNANLQTAITSWAYDADDLFIYMTDHGGDGTFRMGPAELLYATELDTWLDSIQNTIPGKLVLVYDACRSGSFLPLLTPPAGKTRILVSSAGKDEESMFFLQGKISFSFMFWASIFNGDSFYNSYISASENIGKTYRNPHAPRQVPLLDANANGIGNEKEDKTLAQAVVLGNGIVSGADIPFIGSVSPAQTLNGPTSAKIYAENVVDADGISRVWAVITPPDHAVSPDDPVTDMPMIELKSVGGNRYEGSYDSFTVNGTYNIAVFAADNQSFMGIPLQTGVIQTGGTSGTNTVSGYVSTAMAGHTDLSVINAEVSLSNTAYSTVTDSNGYFRLENVNPGPYTLVIAASGMNPVTVPINVQTGANAISNIPQMSVQGSCDVNGDGRIGLEEAIHALQVTVGIGE